MVSPMNTNSSIHHQVSSSRLRFLGPSFQPSGETHQTLCLMPSVPAFLEKRDMVLLRHCWLGNLQQLGSNSALMWSQMCPPAKWRQELKKLPLDVSSTFHKSGWRSPIIPFQHLETQSTNNTTQEILLGLTFGDTKNWTNTFFYWINLHTCVEVRPIIFHFF